MKKSSTILIILLLFVALNSDAQTRKINAGGIEIKVSAADPLLRDAFNSVGEMPEFPGGTKKLVAFAKSRIKYPKSAINDNVEGSVILSFSIDKTGKVINKQMTEGVRHDLNKVCLAMLTQMPKWTPGRLNGKPVMVNEAWKITFVLTD